MGNCPYKLEANYYIKKNKNNKVSNFDKDQADQLYN